MTDTLEQLLETWRINQRVNERLLRAISPEGLACTLSKRGGRTVGKQFAHLHQVRLQWIEASAKDLVSGLTKPTEAELHNTQSLLKHLRQSSAAMETLMERSFAAGKLKGHSQKLIPFVGYALAHEAHHRGNIILTLKECGHKIDQQTQYAIWEWGKI